MTRRVMTTNPATDLRRINRRIAELQVQQRDLITRIGLEEKDEGIVLSSLELANDIQTFLDRVHGDPTPVQRRQGIAFSRRLERVSARLEKLPTSDAKQAAIDAATEAAERLLSTLFFA